MIVERDASSIIKRDSHHIELASHVSEDEPTVPLKHVPLATKSLRSLEHTDGICNLAWVFNKDGRDINSPKGGLNSEPHKSEVLYFPFDFVSGDGGCKEPPHACMVRVHETRLQALRIFKSQHITLRAANL